MEIPTALVAAGLPLNLTFPFLWTSDPSDQRTVSQVNEGCLMWNPHHW